MGFECPVLFHLSHWWNLDYKKGCDPGSQNQPRPHQIFCIHPSGSVPVGGGGASRFSHQGQDPGGNVQGDGDGRSV